jgi:hypothetical protein
MARYRLTILALAALAWGAWSCASDPAGGAPGDDLGALDAAATPDEGGALDGADGDALDGPDGPEGPEGPEGPDGLGDGHGADGLAQDARTLDAGPPPGAYADWMSELLAAHPDRDVTLLDVAIPRAHDAGTYLLTTCSLGAIACNTQTQRLDMTQMLAAGVRSFDVRPVLAKGGGYFSHHTNSCHGAGCEGDSIQSMLAQTRAFVDAHAELVILELGHFCDTGAEDAAFVALIEAELGERLYREPTPDARPIIERPLAELIGLAGGQGKVLVLFEGLADTPADRAAGRFPASALPRTGAWSNKQLLDELVADQLQRWADFANDGTTLFELGWTMTMDTDLVVACLVDEAPRSIESMAAETNGVLAATLDALIADGAIAKGRIPHVLSVDYADAFVTEQALRLSGLNLD